MHNSLTPNVIVFRDRACKDVIKVKWGHMNGALIQKADVLSRGGDTRTRWEGSHLQVRKRLLARNQPCGHLDLRLPASKIRRNCCLSTQSVLFYYGGLHWQKHYSRKALGLETSHLVLRMKFCTENRVFRKSPNNEGKDHWICVQSEKQKTLFKGQQQHKSSFDLADPL